jgi:hypothetical protein
VGKPHTVIEIRSARLLSLHEPRITLTPFNTGSALHSREYPHARVRGLETFKRIADYNDRWVKELAVESGIPDLTGLVSSVKRCVAHSSNWSNPDYEVLEIQWSADS